MRIGLGAIVPITRYDQSTPDFVAQLTLNDCIPYQCGFDPSNMAMRYACSTAGFPGSRTCYDPLCKNYCGPATAQPAVPNPVLPVNVPALVPIPQPVPQPVLRPSSIVTALPDITRPLAPVRVPDCTCWEKLNGWIHDNPVLAVAALGGAFLFVMRKH